MSFRAMSWAVNQSGLGSTAKFVLIMLADRASDDDLSCFPSIKKLAIDTDLTERTVINCIQKLEELGLITVEREHRKVNRYLLQMSRVKEIHPQGEIDSPNRVKEIHTNLSVEPIKESIRRSTSISEGTEISEKQLAYAQEQMQDSEIHEEFQRFKDYHLSKGSLFKDWNAAWRTWLNNSKRWAPKKKEEPYRMPKVVL